MFRAMTLQERQHSFAIKQRPHWIQQTGRWVALVPSSLHQASHGARCRSLANRGGEDNRFIASFPKPHTDTLFGLHAK